MSVLTNLLRVAVSFDCPDQGGVSSEGLDPEWGGFHLCSLSQDLASEAISSSSLHSIFESF